MGLALFYSLRSHLSSFRLHVLCLDEQSCELLSSLQIEQLNPVPLSNLEKFDQELLRVKSNRSRVEYIFTCTPCFPHFLLNSYPEIEFITYLDSDLFFFASPEVILEEIGSAPVAIVPHRFAEAIKNDFLRFGEFNVAWVSFRRDPTGLAALQHWRMRCLEWCKDEVQDERYADQKYLEEFPKLYPSTHVISHPGANVARWNLQSLECTVADCKVRVNGQPLVFYHFEGLRELFLWVYSLGFDIYRDKPNQITKDFIYRPYLRALRNARAMRPTKNSPLVPRRRTDFELRSSNFIYRMLVRLALTVRMLFSGQAVIDCN